jgi:hypothetical protein
VLDDDGEGDAAEELRAAGIEVVGTGPHSQPDAWLSQRRHHYSVVLTGPDIRESVATLLHDSQPLATYFADGDGREPLATLAQRAGLVITTPGAH